MRFKNEFVILTKDEIKLAIGMYVNRKTGMEKMYIDEKFLPAEIPIQDVSAAKTTTSPGVSISQKTGVTFGDATFTLIRKKDKG